ncbi:ABC transporter permease [Cytobacillus firmus]|jgi:general nucleoside transport system permease protein|uniref:ABC transporter permease n=1 Tax=Cytobacillus firmus TaxID=1399 RepID=A0AA46Q4J1_CYTFI|nr:MULTISPECIES: ABC transporter permease [Bacillaceae]KML43700.1 branched-chain amino acid ABC transporter permease [Cytobacillus firmus]MBG9445513.1 branched-chain amino acid ABC transporter permease [Cytobacillus firmus]MBG9450353.1 branched-chain amino acid ABC transporter permease [Cytobacillus firmus]MBG9589141.1 branched-chain amino acid ABC transporter permease [Cytobacillus firmus]MCC3645758.1 ABC transporter permease [Cytobacillus oceanisediminis]
MSNRMKNIVVPLVAVLLGVLVGTIIMIATGYNAGSAFIALWNGAFGEIYYTGEVVRQVTPYILAGLAVAFAFRTGLFNIGVEGQLIVGWLAAVWVGVAFELPKFIHLPLAVLAAAAAGALWAFIPGLLKAKFKVHEVIVTIMMNYVALHVTNYIIRTVLSEKSDRTEMIAESASLRSPFLEGLTDYSRLHWGILIALACVFIMWFLLEKTSKGYELRAVGFNQHASEYAGMSVSKNIILSMVISGAFAGLAGAMEALGTFGYAAIKGGFTGVGFDGIAVALLGGNGPIGIIFAALLFGSLKVGALNMPLEAGVPNELVDIIIALIVFFVAASYMIRIFIDRISKKGVK